MPETLGHLRKRLQTKTPEKCPGAESNHRHEDLQSPALPTELPGHRTERRFRMCGLGGFLVLSRGNV